MASLTYDDWDINLDDDDNDITGKQTVDGDDIFDSDEIDAMFENVGIDKDHIEENFDEDSIVVIQDATKKLSSSFAKSANVFDPRILGEKEDIQQKWSSQSVELANRGLSQGYKLKENPFLKYVKDVNLRKARLPFNYSDDEKWAIKKCMQDKIFFGNNFISLKQEDVGWERIKLRSYQVETLKKYHDFNWNLLMFPRQSGKTTTTVVEIVHFCTFNIDKDCVVIAQSDLVVSEILKKIKEAFSSLPFFMQPGFVSFTKDGFVLDNGCRLKIGIASESVVQGFSLDLLFIDEFAYIPASRVNKFWNNIYPALVNNPNSRCIIASTPNGRNKFYELWTSAEAGLNRFKTSRIRWWEVPRRPMDDETPEQALERFKQDTIANMGLEGWEMGFECSFDTQLKSIFGVTRQKTLRAIQDDYKEHWTKHEDLDGNKCIEMLSQEKFAYNFATDYFTFSIDISEGLEQDYSIIKIRKIVWNVDLKKLQYVTVCVYRNNIVSVEDFAEYLLTLSLQFNHRNIKIFVETNQFGGEFFAHIDNLITHHPDFKNIDKYIFGKYHRSSKDDFEIGIRYDKGNKKTAVRSFKSLVDSDNIIETHWQSIEEYLNFGKMKNDTYAAQYGHDDLVMVDVTLSAFLKSNSIYSNEFINNCMSELRYLCGDYTEEHIQKQKEIEKQKQAVFVSNGYVLRNYNNEVGNVDSKVVRLTRKQEQIQKIMKARSNDDDYFDDKYDRRGNPIRRKNR